MNTNNVEPGAAPQTMNKSLTGSLMVHSETRPSKISFWFICMNLPTGVCFLFVCLSYRANENVLWPTAQTLALSTRTYSMWRPPECVSSFLLGLRFNITECSIFIFWPRFKLYTFTDALCVFAILETWWDVLTVWGGGAKTSFFNCIFYSLLLLCIWSTAK